MPRAKEFFAKFMCFKQVTETRDGCRVSNRLSAKVNTGKPAPDGRVIQGFFHRWIGKVKPVLEQVDMQHALNPNGGRPLPALG